MLGLRYDLTVYDHNEPIDEYFRDYCMNNWLYKSVKFYGLTLKQVFNVIRIHGRKDYHYKLEIS